MEKSSIDPKQITPEDLGKLLRNIFSNDSTVINQCTVLIKKYLELAYCITPLLFYATNDPDERIRLLAYICLKSSVPKHWVALSTEAQDQVKKQFLSNCLSEPIAKVKENLAYVVGSLSSILVPNNEWKELIEFINSNCKSPNMNNKELGSLLLFAVTDPLRSVAEPYLDSIVDNLKSLISISNQNVQRMATRTINCLLVSDISSSSFLKLENFIPVMMKMMLGLEDNEGLLQEVYENFIEVLELKKVLQSQLPFLMNTALIIGKDKNAGTELRRIALYFVETAFNFRSSSLKKDERGITAALEVGFMVAAENEEDFDKEDESPIDAALNMLSMLSIKVPNTIVYPLIMKGCEEYLKDSMPLKKKASLRIIGMVSKGVRDPMTENVEKIVDTVLRYINDESNIVQEAVVLTLCELSESLAPEILALHSKIFLVLLKAFETKDTSLRFKIFRAIELFCENLREHQIEPYIKPLLECLITHLEFPQMEIKRSVLLALAAVIEATKQNIIPYYLTLMQSIMKYVYLDEDEYIKAKAIIVIGRLAAAAGKELFKPYLEKCTQHVLSELETAISEVKEAAYSYFGDVAKILKEEFTPLLPTLIPSIINTLLLSDVVEDPNAKVSNEQALADPDESDEDTVMVRTALIDEKFGALHVLGIFAKECPKGFLPYMKESLDHIENMREDLHEYIRYHITQTLQEFVEGVNLAFFDGAHPKPIPSLPPKVKMCDDAYTLYFERVFPRYITTLKDDVSREIVVKTLESICDLIKAIGSAIIGDHLKDYIDCIVLLLKQKAACMSEDVEEDVEEECDCGSEEEEKGGEVLDHDEMLLANLIELIQDIAKASGPTIIPQYKVILDLLVKYTGPPHPENDCVIAVGAFCDLFKTWPEILPQYVNTIYPLCIKGCQQGSDDLIRNSAYCLGLIVEYGKDLTTPHINEVLSALKSAFEIPKTQEPKDNAVSSLLRVLITHYDKVPLELVIPAIFENVPLNGDLEENVSVARNFNLLPLDIMKHLEKYIEKILLVCFKVIIDKRCGADEEIKGLVGKYVVKLGENEKVRQVVSGLMVKMSEEEKATLMKYVH